MKAFRLHSIGDIKLDEIDIPEIDSNSVLVKVHAAGICGSDIPRIYKTGAHKMPLILGHEFAGEVVKTGSEKSQSWLGKRVGVFPLIPCMRCRQCQKKQYEMCDHYDYLGSRSDGGFAEYVKVPAWNLIELPENVSMEQAAMLEPMAVAIHAIRRIGVNASDTVAICGLGTIGLFVLMFLKSMGIKNVYAGGNKGFQKEKALELGICEDDYCDTREQQFADFIMNKTNGIGVDVFFDCVGKNEVICQGVESLAAKGRLMLVGNPVSDIDMKKELYWKILRRQLTLVGTWNSSFTQEIDDDWHFVLEMLKAEAIHPENLITHKMSIQDFEEGFLIMRDKKEDYVKIMLVQ